VASLSAIYFEFNAAGAELRFEPTPG